MRLNPKQKYLIKKTNARLNITHGSVRSGKSVGLDYRFIKAIGEDKIGLPPDAVDVMVGKTLSSLKRNVINPIIQLVGSRNAQYFSGKQEFHVFGNIVHTIGANDERSEGKIRGSTINKALGDEITLWPESFFRMLDSRLSLSCSQFFGSTNPGPPNHWLKKDYIDRASELDMMVLKFMLEDNKALSKRYVDAIMKNYTGLWYKRFIEGEWCVAEGAIYDYFNEDEHTLSIDLVPEYYVVGVDYGTSNPFSAILMGVNRKSKPKIWAIDEYYYNPVKEQMQKTDLEFADDLVNWLIQAVGPHWQNRVRAIYIDPSAESFQLQLKRKNVFSVTDAVNDVIPGILTVSSMMKSGEYAIHQRCKSYIEEMYSYVWDANAQVRGIDKPSKINDHCQDAGRYAVHSEFGEEYVDIYALAAA